MNLPTLTDEGLIYRAPELFRHDIEFTLDHWSHRLAPKCVDWEFLEGASLLAAEVYASGLDWKTYSDRFRAAATRFGMPAEEADELLAIAWKSAPHRPARWIEMTREWLRLRDNCAIIHVVSGAAIPGDRIRQVFSDIMEEPSCELAEVFFDHLVEVHRVTDDPAVERGFHMTVDGLVFNSP